MMRHAALVLTGGLALALTGCSAVQEAANTADTIGNAASTASVCAQAVEAATFTPDLTDPQAAADQAHTAADELTALSAEATDTTINEAIDNLATTMRETTVTELTNGPEAWLRTQTDQLAALSKACGL